MLYEGDGLRLTKLTCYLWEMALIVGFDVSLDNKQDWEGRREKTG
jgi:hypothetical protein